MSRRSSSEVLGGLDLIEEAVHALRQAPAGTLLCYLTGAAPFVLAFLYFWSDMSRSALAEKHLVGGAAGLALLFVWMKTWQSVFALRLAAQVANHPVPALRPGMLLRGAGTQALLHATGLVLIPVAAQFLIPTVWVFGFYQNATVLGLQEPGLRTLAARSWRLACWSVRPAHVALVALGLLGLFVFLNLGIAILVAPHLLKILLGIESHTTLSLMSGVNTTFLAATLGATYLCVDPLIKAVHVVRCFYGSARTTGEDLRVNLRTWSQPVLPLLLVICWLAGGSTAGAATPAPDPASPPARELSRAIDRVLERPEYTWRAPRERADGAERPETPAMLQRAGEWIKSTVRAIWDGLERLFRRTPRPGGGRGLSFSAEGFTYLLVAAALVIIGALAWFLWKRRSRLATVPVEATPAAPAPDLTRDDVAGDELPVDAWLSMGLDLLERGELRLAMRAFYFSSLAHLAERSLVTIARGKSNRDYERELLRRSHALPGVGHSFSHSVIIFDRVWYGRHDINGELLQEFRQHVERIRAC